MESSPPLGNSKRVMSNQTDLHIRLDEIVMRHLKHPFKKPIAAHTQLAFEETERWLAKRTGEIILDSGCGVGESSYFLASQNPNAAVVAVDRSAHRLAKHKPLENLYFVRADLVDFWRLAADANWQLAQHAILYPNPYPKAVHVQRRWHASPVFKAILALGGELTVRSNWHIYIAEFVRALELVGIFAKKERYFAEVPMSAFERKYWASGQSTWQCRVKLDPAVDLIKC